MDQARRERLKESLLILEDLSESQREAWIAERLADDPALAAEAARLAAVRVDERLTPMVVPPEAMLLTGLLPQQIGPFVVEGLIAQGGMGSVYRAHQIVPVRRRAAVKVLRAEFGGPQLASRFEDERRALARLEHRNIARFLDAGTAVDGRAYIAMELVDGPPITEYAALHRLTLSQRLRLFVQVCRGVQHAHNRGILHRDLKPSNILVADEDAQPVPKVIDFGVSKLVAEDATRSGQTIAGQVLGTLGYMSPEQADRGHPDADIRSDVYALGAILYELLTGALPVPSETLASVPLSDLAAAIRAHPRMPPSKAVRLSSDGRSVEPVPTELDCLVLKACAPDPDERYGSASELAADLERYLDGRPIAARPPSAWYQLRKFVVRHRFAVLSATLVLAALLVGVSLALLGFRRALIDREAAEAALRQVSAEKDRADQALARSEEVATYLRELLMRAHPSRLGPRASFEEILKAAANDFNGNPPTDALVAAEVAFALAEPLYLIGDYDSVERLLEGQIDLLDARDEPRPRSLVTSMMLRLGYVASRKSLPQLAAERFERAARLADRADSAHLRFQASGALAQTYAAGGEYDRAIAILREMLASETAQRDELLRASALSNLGVALGRKGAAAEGLPFAREGYEIRVRRAPKDSVTHSMGWQLGISYMENGQLDDAVEIIERTQAAATDAVGADHADVVAGVVLLHFAKARRGDGATSIPPMREAIDRQRRLGIPLQQVAQSRMYLAGALVYVGERDAARAEADDTLRELTLASSDCDKSVVAVLLQIGTIFSAAGAAAESVPYLERAFRCTEREPAVAAFAPRIAGAIVWSYRRMQDEANAERWREIARSLRGAGASPQ